MLDVRIVSKKFKNKELYNDSNIKFNQGIYILKGLNGSGKTTLFNMLYRLDNDYEGELLFEGKNIKEIEISEYRTNYITYVKQEFNLFTNLTPKENIELLSKVSDSYKYSELVKGLNLFKVVNSKKKITKFSGGEIQKVKLLIGLMSDTPVILLDEPDNNLDIKSISFLIEFLKKENRLLIISTHSIDDLILENYENVNIIEINNKKFEILRTSAYNENKKEIKKSNNKLKISDINLNKLSKKFLLERNVIYIISLLLIFISLILCSQLFLTFSYYRGSVSKTMDDNIVEIYAPMFNPLLFQYGDEKFLNKTPYYFTSEDYDRLKQFDTIDYITPIGTPSSVIFKEYTTDATIDLNTLDYESYEQSLYKSEEMLSVEQYTCTEPQRVNVHGDFTCTGVGELLYGEYPKDNSNEVGIDLYIALYYAQHNGLKSLEDILGNKVKANLIYDNPFNEEEPVEISKEFIISGIFEPIGYYNKTANFITAFQENGYVDYRNHLWKDKKFDGHSSKEIMYDKIKNLYLELGLEVPIINDIPDVKDNAYPGFYIEMKDTNNVEKLVESIRKYDPYIYIKSNYTNEHTNNFIYLKNYYFKYILVIMVLLLLIFFITYLILKYYMNSMKKEIEKLEFFGFSNKEVKKYKKKNAIKLYRGLLIMSMILIIIWLYFSIIYYYIYYVFIAIGYVIIYMVFIKLVYKIK